MNTGTMQELAQVRTLPRTSTQLDGLAVIEGVISLRGELASIYAAWAVEDLRKVGFPEGSTLRTLPIAVLSLSCDLDLVPLRATHPRECRISRLIVRQWPTQEVETSAYSRGLVSVDREFLGRSQLRNPNLVLVHGHVLGRAFRREQVIPRFRASTWVSQRSVGDFRFFRALHLGKVNMGLLCNRWLRPIDWVPFFLDQGFRAGSTLDDLALLGLLFVVLVLLHFLTVARVSEVAQVAGVLSGHA